MTVLDRPRIKSEKDLTKEFIAHPRSAWRMAEAPWCAGIVRVKLDERQRALVRPHWPADHPRIWTLADWQAQTALRRALWPPRVERPALQSWVSADLFHFAGRGPPPAIYPTSYGISLARLDANTGKDGVFYLDSRIGDGVVEKGFLDCDAGILGPLSHAVTGRDPKKYLLPVCRVDGVTIPTPRGLCSPGGWVAFERDDYAIVAIDAFSD